MISEDTFSCLIRTVFSPTVFSPNSYQLAAQTLVVCCVLTYIANAAGLAPCASSPCQHGVCRSTSNTTYNCTCAAGYVGLNCQTEIDECLSNPCLNDAGCLDLVANYSCLCLEGYTGYRCESDVNECASNPCQNAGSCVNAVNSYSCICSNYSTGYDCETTIVTCASSPCQNNASCGYDISRGYHCFCPPEYSGFHCETEVDYCNSTPCQQNGTCTDFTGGYNCTCSPGYTGSICETEIDECTSIQCPFNGRCVDLVNEYSCLCPAGLTGPACNIDVDECGSSPCQHEGSCLNSAKGYNCTCTPGYTGPQCQTDINECSSNPCLSSGVCNDFINFYICACAAGYTGYSCETDINECLSSPCQNEGQCMEAGNGYYCNCTPYFVGLLCEKRLILNVFPTFGPLAGGTKINLFTNPIEEEDGGIIPSKAHFGSQGSANFSKIGVGQFFCYSPPGQVSNLNVPLVVTFDFTDGLKRDISFSFTYLSNPNISAVYPRELLYTGGTQFWVEGTGMNVSSIPLITVTTITQRLRQANQWLTDTAGVTGLCIPINDTLMSCTMPITSIPASFQAYIDAQNILPNTNPYPPNTDHLEIPGGKLTVYVGFTFDYFTSYQNLSSNLSDVTLILYPPPVIPFISGRFAYAPAFRKTYSIPGRNMTRGAGESDYSVTMEGLDCPILSLQDYSVTFNFSDLYANTTRVYAWACLPGDFHVEVTVGYQSYPIGCLERRLQCYSTPCSNGGTCIDSKVPGDQTYTCVCSYNYYGSNCQLQYPVLTGIFPSYGALFGGTQVTISGTIPAGFRAMQLYFSNSSFVPIKSSNNVSVVVVSPPGDPSTLNDTLSLTVTFSLGTTIVQRKIAGNFTYKPNPVLTGIHPRQQLYTGGILLTVVGNNMDSVAIPVLQVAMVTSRYYSPYHITDTATFSSICTLQDSSDMTCPVPNILVPGDILPYLDTDNDTLVYATYDSLMENGFAISFYVGFQLDGITAYRNLSALMDNVTLQIYAPPVISPQYFLYDASNRKPITIVGRDMTRACSVSDYSISVEDVPCTISKLSTNSVVFVPLNATPAVATDSLCNASNPFQIFIKIGFKRIMAGCINYTYPAYDPCWSGPCQNNGTCDHDLSMNLTDYTCECLTTGIHYGPNCEFEFPELYDFSPTFGPVQGGTNVTINAMIPIGLTAIAVKFGNFTSYVIRKSSRSEITVSTLTVLNETSFMNLSVYVIFNNTYLAPTPANGSFVYHPNPVITSISPRDQLYTGGTSLTITGNFMDADLTPVITSTLMVQRLNVPTPEKTTQSTPCQIIDSTRIECNTSAFFLAADVISSLDQPSSSDGSSRRKRRSTDDQDPLRSKRSSTLPPLVHQGCYLGLVFDGYDYYRNLSDELANSSILLHSPPIIPADISFLNQTIRYYSNRSQIVEIIGINLLLGCQQSDYAIKLEDVDCTIIVVNSTRIQFYPPSDPPTKNLSIQYNCRDSLRLTVHIGIFSAVVGCLVYDDSNTAVLNNYGYTLGAIGGAVGGALLIALLVLLATKEKIQTKYKK